jgi:hypothetical protein
MGVISVLVVDTVAGDDIVCVEVNIVVLFDNSETAKVLEAL